MENGRGKSMKQPYNMIDGIPIWRHLRNCVEEKSERLIASDYGKFAEILGERLLYKLIKKGGILEVLFPGTDIVSVQKSPRVRILARKKVEIGDLALEISYRDSCSGTFGKKIVIFEIKHGKAPIEQNQLRRYCFMINSHEEYFPKADEVRIVFLMISKINTNKGSSSYSICELAKDLARKILENFPTTPFDDSDSVSNVDNTGNVEYATIDNIDNTVVR